MTHGRTARPLTEIERITIAHLVADHAASFYGQRGSMFFGKTDAVRYITEGYVGKLITDVDWDVLWTAVGDELDAHPEILAAGSLTNAQRAERQAAREAAARPYDIAAASAYERGDYAEAAALVDAAERECPRPPGFTDWDRLRDYITSAYDEAGQPAL